MEYIYKNLQIPIALSKKEIKRGNKKDFITLYYYKKNVDKYTREKADITATSKYHYKKDLFYKETLLSNKSKIWDYYKVLKPNTPATIAVGNCKVRKIKESKEITYNTHTPEGGIIVNFD